MNHTLERLQIAMNHDHLQLESVAQNLSNMHSTGYKRQWVVANAFAAQMASTRGDVANQITTVHSKESGVLNSTQRSLDLAIQGEGYFAVQHKNEVRYTRRGDFRVNQQGELLTFDGYPVLGESGPVHLDSDPVTVETNGTLYQQQKPVGKLQIVRFSHPDAMHSAGKGYFLSMESPQPADGKSHIRQGFLEQSNVNSVDEMMELIRISRHFQSTQRIMRIADELLHQAITQLGEG